MPNNNDNIVKDYGGITADHETEDKYPNYDPQHWYLSIIKTNTPRRKRLVAIRPLISSAEDLNRQMVTREV